MSTSAPTLDVRNLRTVFDTRAGSLPAVDDVSFTLSRGRVLGLVGESGSGKSVTGFSIMGLVDRPGRVAGGQILFQGRDLATLPARELRQLRGNRIAMVFQDPMMTLNPVLRVDTQMIEAVQAHKACTQQAAREIALAFGVPPLLLGLPGDNTHANYAEANRAFYRQTVIPLVRRTADSIARWLEPAFGPVRLEPDLDAVEALAAERESLWRRLQGADFLSDAEKREAVGYPAEIPASGA